MAEKLSVTHVERPNLPWRKPEAALTECSLVATSYPTITRLEFVSRLKEWGEQRTSLTTCMVCYQTASRYATWDEDPLDGIERAMRLEKHIGGWRFGRRQFLESVPWRAPGTPLRTELRAMAELIDRHREEFEDIIDDLGHVISLSEARQQRLKERREGRRKARSGR